MDDIVGRQFSVDEVRYTVVDVRNITGNKLVFAESEDIEKGRPARAAFHYADIEPILSDSPVSAAGNVNWFLRPAGDCEPGRVCGTRP